MDTLPLFKSLTAEKNSPLLWNVLEKILYQNKKIHPGIPKGGGGGGESWELQIVRPPHVHNQWNETNKNSYFEKRYKNVYLYLHPEQKWQLSKVMETVGVHLERYSSEEQILYKQNKHHFITLSKLHKIIFYQVYYWNSITQTNTWILVRIKSKWKYCNNRNDYI